MFPYFCATSLTQLWRTRRSLLGHKAQLERGVSAAKILFEPLSHFSSYRPHLVTAGWFSPHLAKTWSPTMLVISATGSDLTDLSLSLSPQAQKSSSQEFTDSAWETQGMVSPDQRSGTRYVPRKPDVWNGWNGGVTSG